MKRRSKMVISLSLIFVLLTLSTTGCWNLRELPSLAIVLGVGVDSVDEGLQLTAQIVKTSAIKSSNSNDGNNSGDNNSSDDFWNVRNTGNNMFATIRDFTHISNRKLYFPHNQVLIFGHSLAEKGVKEYIDFFLRDQETRLEVWVLVAEETACEVFDVQPKLEKIPSMNIATLMEAQAANSQTCAVKLNEFITRLMSPTTSPIAPIVEVRGTGSNRELIVTGTAIFKRDKLIGQLTKEETRGLLWVINKVKSGIITIDCPEGDGKVGLEIINAKSKITSQIIDQKPHITVEIKEEGSIADQSCSDDLISSEAVEKLETSEAAAIREEISSALSKAQKLNADIFGFGDMLHQKHPTEWNDLKDQWDQLFPSLDVQVDVDAKVRRSGLIGRPVAPEKEK